MSEYLSPVIKQGRICKGYISGLRYVHSAIRFEYRALWPQARRQYLQQMSKLAKASAEDKSFPTAEDQLTAKMLSRVVTSWNVQDADSDGNMVPVAISEEGVLSLDETIFNRMSRIVCRLAESDVDPEDNPEGQLTVIDNQQKTAEQLVSEIDLSELEAMGNSVGE